MLEIYAIADPNQLELRSGIIFMTPSNSSYDTVFLWDDGTSDHNVYESNPIDTLSRNPNVNMKRLL